MEVRLQKWGNSNAIRIPKHIITELKLKENDSLIISCYNNEIILSKPKRITIEERIKNYNGVYESREYFDPEDVVGNELW